MSAGMRGLCGLVGAVLLVGSLFVLVVYSDGIWNKPTKTTSTTYTTVHHPQLRHGIQVPLQHEHTNHTQLVSFDLIWRIALPLIVLGVGMILVALFYKRVKPNHLRKPKQTFTNPFEDQEPPAAPQPAENNPLVD